MKLSYDNTSSKLASTPKNCFVHFLIFTFTFSFLPGGLSYSLLSPPASPAIIGGHKEKHLNSHFKTDSDSGWCWHRCRTFAGENNWDCGVKHCCWQRWFNFLEKNYPTNPSLAKHYQPVLERRWWWLSRGTQGWGGCQGACCSSPGWFSFYLRIFLILCFWYLVGKWMWFPMPRVRRRWSGSPTKLLGSWGAWL